MVEIQIEYEGQLHCRARHAPSGAVLATDAPTDNMGKGESFSPTDLVATAFGSCILTILGITARRQGIAFEKAHARVTKEMTPVPPRRIGRLTLEVHVPDAVSDEDRRLLEGVALSCPVALSLHPQVEVAVRFCWAGER